MVIHNTPSGQIAKRGHPTERFPGSVEFRGFGALSDALIGLRGWDSPVVLKEAAMVLGTDDKAAWTYVNSVRKAIIDSWSKHFNLVKEAEKAAFGQKSYFGFIESGGIWKATSLDAARNDPDDISVEG